MNFYDVPNIILYLQLNFLLSPSSIDSTSGQITPTGTLDYEKMAGETYNLTVRAFDLGSPSLSADVAVVVYLIDQNDNPPLFSRMQYAVTIPEVQC